VPYAVLLSKVKLGMCELKDMLIGSLLPFGHIDGPVDGPAAEENNMRAITMVGDCGTGTAAPSELHIGMERKIATSRCWDGVAATMPTLIPTRIHTGESSRANHCRDDNNYDNMKHNRGPGGEAHVEGAGHTHGIVAASADDDAYQEGDQCDCDHCGDTCGNENETPVLSGRSTSSGEAHIYGSSCAVDTSASTSFRGVDDDQFETSDAEADKNSMSKWVKPTSPTSILGKCYKRSDTLLRWTEGLLSGVKDAVFNVDSRHAVDSSKGLGNLEVEEFSFILGLTLFAVFSFVIAATSAKMRRGCTGKNKGRYGRVEGKWGGQREGRSKIGWDVKMRTSHKRIPKMWGFNLAFILFLLIAGVSGVNVVDMNGLFNTVSNYQYATNTGNSIMVNGDTTILAVGSYKCSEGTCSASHTMLRTEDLNGEVKCVEDNASCVLDGENTRRGMVVYGTGSGTLILRALTFDKGYRGGGSGGGVYIYSNAIMDLELLVFSNNKATDSSWGGGAIYVSSSGGNIVNIYGTSFIGNTADTYGDDITIEGGTITIHNTCPSPYSSNTPIQGKTRMRIV
jgi:predicted outer membrane repeat protein